MFSDEAVSKINSRSDKEKQFEIQINNRNVVEICDQIDAMLEIVNDDPPELFYRGLDIVRIVRDSDYVPHIQKVNMAMMRGFLCEYAEFVTYTIVKKQYVKSIRSPSKEILEELMSRVELPLPNLKGIIEIPSLLGDGTLIIERGYDWKSQLYYIPEIGINFNIPDEPTQEDVEKAKNMLLEILIDFKFDDFNEDGIEINKANAIAALITPIVRTMIDGLIPLCILDKPQAGTGASYFARIVALILTGRSTMTTAPKESAEWRKKITSLLADGKRIIIFDNIEERLYSPELAAILTMPEWEDRVLGKSEVAHFKNESVWMATGNNIQLAGDLPRRCYQVRMDARMALPQLRANFKYPDLDKWVIKNRNEIISAIITIGRAWINAGKPIPDDKPILSGYQEWADTLSGILDFIEIQGFLKNLEKMYEESDVEGPQWALFLEVLRIWQPDGFTVRELSKRLELEKDRDFQQSISQDGISLLDVLPDLSKKGDQSRVIGNAFAKRNLRRYQNGCYLKKCDLEKRAIVWKVEKEDETNSPNSLKNKPKLSSGELANSPKSANSPANSPEKGEHKNIESKKEGNNNDLFFSGELGELDHNTTRGRENKKTSYRTHAETNSPNSPNSPNKVLVRITKDVNETIQDLEGISYDIEKGAMFTINKQFADLIVKNEWGEIVRVAK